MNKIKKFLSVGPGGMKCACCFYAPSSRGRKAKFRAAKRKEKRAAIKIECEAV